MYWYSNEIGIDKNGLYCKKCRTRLISQDKEECFCHNCYPMNTYIDLNRVWNQCDYGVKIIKRRVIK